VIQVVLQIQVAALSTNRRVYQEIQSSSLMISKFTKVKEE
jgi:hypothetical protein